MVDVAGPHREPSTNPGRLTWRMKNCGRGTGQAAAGLAGEVWSGKRFCHSPDSSVVNDEAKESIELRVEDASQQNDAGVRYIIDRDSYFKEWRWIVRVQYGRCLGPQLYHDGCFKPYIHKPRNIRPMRRIRQVGRTQRTRYSLMSDKE